LPRGDIGASSPTVISIQSADASSSDPNGEEPPSSTE
jgi:hypothetical protein